MIKVMIVDDQRLFIDGLRALISNEIDIEVIATAVSVNQAIEKMVENTPDIILMDVQTPYKQTARAIVKMIEKYSGIKVIVLTTIIDEDLIISSINAGCKGYLLKNHDSKHLLRAIRDVYHNEVVFSGKISQILARKIIETKYDNRELLNKAFLNRNIHLSNRELDIACLLTENMSNKRIAQRLFLSEGTVKNYISGIYTTFQIHNRKELVSYFQRLLQK
ncbi:MAG: response regulator [Bacillota bacterium]|uniref:Response regulator transcription factor n=1 Tax=Virgibacillus salarius TaxID=447199 RepID=A0A941DUP1_9BACI|nr:MULTISPECIES: response regulator transcription factor [Virgibacillus]NAZ08429.1 response regulator [Agaribacter marinus]MBR7795716.1 response regulator transcription factor [Virgibacillus salarius]MCC2248578.1 response regulator transcription factor [Virgibacillus sp. AGTR]MDY7043220.1 response regulator transcription factor [Virgibacillus sp. M23]QRZ18337.1 response regulator transcription factor [Virgibacillus sp. AGTR]